MALHIFTKAIVEDKEFEISNYGDMSRDFTYVDDIVESVKRLIPLPPKPNNPKFDPKKPNPSISSAPYQLFNVGNNNPVELMHMIETLEKALGKVAVKNFMPIQPGDVPATWANVDALISDVGFSPATSIEDGIGRFVEWYKGYY